MVKKRVLVGYGIDVDAVAIHINTTNGAPASLSNVSRGVFGATIGIRRLLKLFESRDIKCSWYIAYELTLISRGAHTKSN